MPEKRPRPAARRPAVLLSVGALLLVGILSQALPADVLRELAGVLAVVAEQ